MAEALNWDQIQGNTTPGFLSHHQALLFFSFPDEDPPKYARGWLEEVRTTVATSREVHAYNDLFRLIKHRRPDVPGEPVWQVEKREEEVYRILGSVLVNVAFSYAGIEALKARWRDRFPPAFKDGLFRREGPIRQPFDVDAARAEALAAHAHVMLIIAADDPDDLLEEVAKQRRNAAYWKLSLEFVRYVGHRLTGMTEHFGFRDGVNQPKLAGPLDSLGRSVSTVAPGEFILGYRDEDELSGGFVRLLDAPFWATDGSYLVFMKMYQDVSAFRQLLHDEAERSDPKRTTDQVAAGLVGRWQSGARIGCPMEAKDPTWQDGKAAEIGFVEFADDPEGHRFPLNSHIRKVFPREAVRQSSVNNPGDDDARKRRLLRRGIPYGPTMQPGAYEDDGQDRGLLFLAYQASISGQFEHVAQEWVAPINFPTKTSGEDPILRGLFEPGPAAKRRARDSGIVPVAEVGGERSPQLVQIRDGGYFFAPSLRALAYLADPANGWRE